MTGRWPLWCASIACLLSSSTALAQQVPERVRLLRPSCSGAIDWVALESALRIELRSMGSDLADGDAPQARLSLDLGCSADAREVVVVLSARESMRALEHRLPLGDAGDPERERVLAVALSELVRARYAELVAAPDPAPALAPAIDVSALRDEIRRDVLAALPEPPPSPEPPHVSQWFMDTALAVAACPMGPYAVGQARLAVSFPIAGLLRGGVELAGGAGGASDPLGDVLLGELGGAATLRVGHLRPDLAIEGGVRVDLGFSHAAGLPNAGSRAGTLDAFAAAIGLDARVRVRLEGAWWLLTGLDIGAALAGLDARAGDRRVAAQLGPRLGLALGVALALD